MRVSLPVTKNVLTLLAKSVLAPLRLTLAASVTDAAIQKKIYRSDMTILIISNEEMKGIMKIFKSLEESDLLREAVSESIKTEAKEQKGRFLGLLLVTLAVTTIQNTLAGKAKILGLEMIRAGAGTIRAAEGKIRAEQGL